MPRRILHIISQAHLDPVWLWPVRDGIAESLTTMQSAVDRMGERKQFKFTRSSACVYRWAKEIDPTLFREIKRLIKEGRWEIVGGWVEQADCNLPATESFLRQALYAKAFFCQEFRVEEPTRIGYNVDSFGHAGGLPQILKASGFDYYVFMRPEPWKNPNIPLLFWWRGCDGSRVLAQRIPIQYSQSYAATSEDIERMVRTAAVEGFAPGFSNGVMWFGTGNHGGGPTREHIARIEKLQRDLTLPELRFSTVRDYFSSVEREPVFASLPVLDGELGYTLRGCYSATGEVKAQHRIAEKSLQMAETLGIMNALGGGGKCSSSDLQEAWWQLLFNEFHDILAGTCIAETQEETRSRFGATLTASRESTIRSAYALARRVDTREEKGSVLFVSNPLPWPRLAVVQIDTFMQPNGREQISHLEAKSGKAVPVQWCSAEANFGPWGMAWGKLSAVVSVPACGYRVLRVGSQSLNGAIKGHGSPDPRNPQFGTRSINEASFVQTNNPALGSLVIAGQELLSRGVGVVIIDDQSGTWSHGVDQFRDELGRAESLGTTLIESGPLLERCRERFRWRRSEFWLDVLHWAHTSVIELRIRFNWQERRSIAKLEISTRLEATSSLAKMPGEIALRPTNGEEFPCHDWVALQGKMKDVPMTVALLNDSTYSYDALDGLLRVPLARGVPFAEHPPFEYKDETFVHFADQGWQERRFWLLADAGGWQSLDLSRLSQECQMPAIAMMDSGHPGEAPWERSFLSVKPASISILAVKPAENGEGVILRVQEMTGKKAVMRAELRGEKFSVTLLPWEIKTLRLISGSEGLQVLETDALER